MNSFYILFEGENKSEVDYDKHKLGESNGFGVIYITKTYSNLLEAMKHMGIEGFTEKFGSPDSLIVFDEKGKEMSFEEFSDSLEIKYNEIRLDF